MLFSLYTKICTLLLKSFSLTSYIKELINLDLSDLQIENMKKSKFKFLVKSRVKSAEFAYLQDMQINHSKTKNIKYHTLKII